MRADRVVDVPVAFDLIDERLPVGDLEPVQVLVLDRLVEPLDDTVGLRRVVAGADMSQLGAGRDEPCEVRRLEQISKRVKSICHTRLRRPGGATKACLRAWASALRSAW